MGVVTQKQRKAESRNRLLDAASELFSEQGYEDTTLDSVADRAGLHVQTLYRHFPCKAELAAELWHRALQDFEIYFAARESKTLDAWRAWLEMNVRQTPNTINALAGRNAPPISSRVFEYWDRYQQILAEGLAEDMGVDVVSDLRPTLIACTLWGGNQRVAMSWVNRRRDEDKLVASLLEIIDATEALFEAELKGNGSSMAYKG